MRGRCFSVGRSAVNRPRRAAPRRAIGGLLPPLQRGGGVTIYAYLCTCARHGPFRGRGGRGGVLAKRRRRVPGLVARGDVDRPRRSRTRRVRRDSRDRHRRSGRPRLRGPAARRGHSGPAAGMQAAEDSRQDRPARARSARPTGCRRAVTGRARSRRRRSDPSPSTASARRRACYETWARSSSWTSPRPGPSRCWV